MSFSDTDPLEEEMGIRCEDMNPDQLVSYILSYHQAFGVKLTVEGVKERSVFSRLQRLYGKSDAGNIVKWAFWKHRGRFRDEPVVFWTFSKGNKWLTDKFHLEMQQQLAEEASLAKDRAGDNGMTPLSSLADMR